MTWSSAGVQTGTDTSLAGITAVTGVTVNVSPNGHKTYQVPTTIGLLTIDGNLSWDSDYETLECSESTRMEVNATRAVIIGKLSTINGKPRWSKGTGLIMNRQQSSPFISTSGLNIWVKAATTLANSGKFIINGCRVMSGGGIFCGNNTTPTGAFVTFEMNGGAVLQNIHASQTMQMVRCFCEPSGININDGTIDGRVLGGLPFSNAGWGALNMSLEFGNFQCDGNGAVAPVRVQNAVLSNNVSTFDYAYVANGNDKTKINKYIFGASDVGSDLRTLGQTGTTWRLGVVELDKPVVFKAQDTDGNAIENCVTYMKLGSASLNPSAGSRYDGIDDYITPRVYIAATDASGLSASQTVLYAVAQGYATDTTGAGTALTMDSLTSRADDIHDGIMLSYDHLVGQPTVPMRGSGTLTQAWTLFADPNKTLSRASAVALLGVKFSFDPATKTATVLANATYSEYYDAQKAFKCSTTRANAEAPNPADMTEFIVTPSGSNLTTYEDWTLVVNTGVTFADAAKFAKVIVDTITINGTGKITGLYQTTTGPSARLTFTGLA